MANNRQSETQDRLIFIYNADSGFVSMLMDWSHKIIRPSTYNCQLCLLTYGNTGMRKKWQSFIFSLPYDPVFLHRDELIKQHPSLRDTTLPCIFIQEKTATTPRMLLDATTLNAQKTLEQLIQTCTEALRIKNGNH